MTDDRWLDEDGSPMAEEDRGLVYDAGTLLSRRRALGLFGALGVGALVTGCSGSPSTSPRGPASSGSASGSASGAGDLAEVPDETGGPFPGDGSNGVDVLDDSGIVRSDIRGTFGDGERRTAEGVPVTVRLTVRDVGTGDARPGCAVYVWQCDRDGNCSLYADGFEDVNYLRGVQEADETGTVEFATVFPGCYPGRWPHIHFEVYESLAGATSEGPIVKTSQIALPKEACTAVYGSAGYERSVDAVAEVSLSGDLVFGDDGGVHQLASMSGSASDGYVAALTIAV
jgi:protocatechuate 3,4-dioxygenase beta subunit